ncbi:MAG: glycosyl transferase, group 1 [Mucilaginibacter sp.]|nr:glycosyl transferase, group 1 [Mucilaginibacter sp.]
MPWSNMLGYSWISNNDNMNAKQNILMYGPLSPPIHGQSLSFTLISEQFLCNKKYIVNTNYTNRNILGKISTTLAVIIKCLYFFSTKKIDLVFFSCSRSVGGSIKDICLINIASFFKIKMINHVHGADFEKLIIGQPCFFKRLIEFSYDKVHTTIVLVDRMKEPFMKFKSMRIRVLPNFYDPVLDEFDDNSHFKNQTYFEVLYLSNIMRTKGVIDLIDAFLFLSEKKHNIRLNIAGEFIGDDESSAEDIKNIFFEKIKGTNKIVYHGILRGENKSKLLYSSDVFVLPSYYVSEAFPLSIVEAMRAGCAIITTRHNYLGDIVKPENGILIDTHNVGQLVEALRYLITNPILLEKIKNHNIQVARNKYSLASSLQSLKLIFNEQ